MLRVDDNGITIVHHVGKVHFRSDIDILGHDKASFPKIAPCGYVARIICFHFCSCRYNCIVGSYLPIILVLNLVGHAKRFSDNKYIYPISSSFIAVSVYWRGGSGLRTLSRNQQTDSEGFNKQTNGTAWLSRVNDTVFSLTGWTVIGTLSHWIESFEKLWQLYVPLSSGP